MSAIDVVVCDDHPVVRWGLKQILESDVPIGRMGEAGSAPELFTLVRTHDWHVVILDISLPGLSGMDALRQIKHERPRLPILIVSVHPPEHYAVRTLRAGAAGYLTKITAADELVRAVRTVVGGHKYVTSEVAERLAIDLERPFDRPAHEALTDREYQVLCLLGSGRTATEAAVTLCLSVKTVSTHRTHVLQKLGLKTTAELIRYVVEHDITCDGAHLARNGTSPV